MVLSRLLLWGRTKEGVALSYETRDGDPYDNLPRPRDPHPFPPPQGGRGRQ